MSTKKWSVVVVMILFCGSSWAALGPIVADIADEHYGAGSGEISFTGAYSWPWSDTPMETSNAGYATLNTGSGIDYACRANGTFNLPTDQWRMDVTMQLHNALGFSFYLGDRGENPASLRLMQVNAAYGETVAHPDVITDYNLRIVDGGEIQPAGFDGSALHTYSFVWNGAAGTMAFYLDFEYVVDLYAGGAGIDSGYEACEFGIGAAKSVGPGVVDFHSMQISSVPEPVTLMLLGVGSLVGLRRRR